MSAFIRRRLSRGTGDNVASASSARTPGEEDFDITIGVSEIVDKPISSLPWSRPWEIVVDAAPWRDIYAHARADLQHEQGGILLGEIYEFEGRQAVRVTAAVPARLATGSYTSLQFNHESWKEVEKNRPKNGEKTIGWYHTHPGFTAFYSDTDAFSHEHFFNLPWQIGLVVDPVKEEHVFMRWEDGKLKRSPVFYLEVEDGPGPEVSLGPALRRVIREADIRGDLSRIPAAAARALTSLSSNFPEKRGSGPLEGLLALLVAGADLERGAADELRRLHSRSYAGFSFADARVVACNDDPTMPIAFGCGYVVQLSDPSKLHIHDVTPALVPCRHVPLPFRARDVRVDPEGNIFLIHEDEGILLQTRASVQEIHEGANIDVVPVRIDQAAWLSLGVVGRVDASRNEMYAYSVGGIHHFRCSSRKTPRKFEHVASFKAGADGWPSRMEIHETVAVDNDGDLLILTGNEIHRYEHMSGKWSVLVRDPSLVRPAAMCVTDVLSVLEEGDPRRISEYSLDDGACLGRRSMDDLLSKSAYVHIFSDRDHFPDGKRGFYLVGVREILRIR